MSAEQVNHTVQASVFEDLFEDEKMRFALYKILHPEDDKATAADIEKVTLKQIFLRGRYNDLGLLANDRLILLVEAQSTWTENIIPRAIVYVGDTLNRYAFSHKFKWYSRKKVAVPRVELYVVYTGNQKIDKTEINLTDEFYEGVKCDIDATVHIITDSGGDDILNQYITFCKILNEQRALYPDTDEGRAEALRETIRICIDKNILREYLQKRQEEVMNIMLTIFDEEYQRKLEIEEEREEAAAEAKIQTTIEMCQEFGKSVSEAVAMLMRKFSLTEADSKGLVNQYWKV